MKMFMINLQIIIMQVCDHVATVPTTAPIVLSCQSEVCVWLWCEFTYVGYFVFYGNIKLF